MTDAPRVLHLSAILREVAYTPCMLPALAQYDISEFDKARPELPSSCIIANRDDRWGFSQWISPKRTRSYPYARVYNTLQMAQRVTLVPFSKDEGRDGDHDFLQWDSVSLMSLLGVHVIIGCYASAQKNTRPQQVGKQKITDQVYDYAHVAAEFGRLQTYFSDALHWNLSQLDSANLVVIVDKAKAYYAQISAETGVEMHSPEAFDRRRAILVESAGLFRERSRKTAARAQMRESVTDQPKESIGAYGKATITMQNLLGGVYSLTADEYLIVGDALFLVEKKHSVRHPVPGEGDLKDAFIKMALFGSIETAQSEDAPQQEFHRVIGAVGITSNTATGALHSNMPAAEVERFIKANNLKPRQQETLRLAIKEAQTNNFCFFVLNAGRVDEQRQLLADWLEA